MPQRYLPSHCRSSSKYRSVEIAHMELAEPSIGTAVAKCASAGCKTAVIAPYFLSRGRHISEDIPALVAEAQMANPNVRCIIAEPIGAAVCCCTCMRASCMRVT
jgi:sirohydrochlorin ferrochelatase